MLPALSISLLKSSAKDFAQRLSQRQVPELYGVTDGKAVGTYVEKEFKLYLASLFQFTAGNSASGIDFPGLDVDLKATSMKQPQSSSPYKSASQKVYGLGHDLLVFVYEKADDKVAQIATLNVRHVVFVAREHTADWQTTVGINGILDRGGNKDDLVAFLEERNLLLDESGRDQLADRILRERPPIGYLTISNALQWRLQYSRVIEKAGLVEGVEDLHV